MATVKSRLRSLVRLLSTSGQRRHVLRLKSHLRPLLKLLNTAGQRRHVFRWMLALKDDHPLQRRQPWLVFDALDFLNSLDLRGKHIFEYGSGGSTLYWVRRGANCVSIEHDPRWFGIVREHLAASPSIDYRLVSPESGNSVKGGGDPANPDRYLSSDSSLLGYTFRDYVSQIDAFPDECFDVILMDGRARPSCIKHSFRKVKAGGMIIVDNSDRQYYFTKTNAYLEDFDRRELYGVGPVNDYMWKTNIYIRAK